jgi:hypothetical protein
MLGPFAPGKGRTAKVATTMNRALKRGFPPFETEQSLRSAIESVCAAFGNVAKLTIYPARRDPGSGLQCPCFLRLNTLQAEAELKSRLKVFEFGDELAFLVDVDEEKWKGVRSL